MARARHNNRKHALLVASRIAVLMPMMLFLAAIPLPAQAIAPPSAIEQQSPATPAPHFTFDVVSIKPSGPNSYGYSGFDTTGFSSKPYSLFWTVWRAYFEKLNGHEIIGMPDWLMSQRYDITARIDEADIPAWMKLSFPQRAQVGRPLLQQLLADRCKLVAHLVPAEVDGYILVVSKRGSRLNPTKPGESYPAGAKGRDDGPRIVFSSPANNMTESWFNVPMEEFADRLSSGGSVIVDRTNLTGRYDFTFRRLTPVDADGKRIDHPEPNDLWDISATGLEIKRAKIPTQNLVIDHIERPSPN